MSIGATRFYAMLVYTAHLAQSIPQVCVTPCCEMQGRSEWLHNRRNFEPLLPGENYDSKGL